MEREKIQLKKYWCAFSTQDGQKTIAIKVSPTATLANVRKSIKLEPSFIFLDQDAEIGAEQEQIFQIQEIAQENKIRLRILHPKVIQTTPSTIQRIPTVYSLVGTERQTLLQVDITLPLSEIRKEIKESFNFTFTQDGISIAESSEPNKLLSSILRGEKKNQFFIQKKSFQTEENSEVSIFEGDKLKLKQKSQAMKKALSDLNQFKQQRKAEGKKNIQQLDAQFDVLKRRCMSIGFTIQSNAQQEIQRVEQLLNQQVNDTQTFLKKIQKQKIGDNRALLRNLDGICQNSCGKRLIEFDRTNCDEFERVPDGYSTEDKHFIGESVTKNLDANMSYHTVSFDMNAAVLSPAAIIKAGFDVNNVQQYNSTNQKITHTKQSTTIRLAVSVMGKYYLTSNLIALKDEVKNAYYELIKLYKQNEKDKLVHKIGQFYKKYGTIETGVYTLGGNYLARTDLYYSKQISNQQANSIGQLTINAAAKGAVITQFGVVAGSVDFNFKKDNFDKKQLQSQVTTVNSSRQFKANPPINNQDLWKEEVTFNKAHWSVLCKNVQKTHINQIMSNSINMANNQGIEKKDFEAFSTVYDKLLLKQREKEYAIKNKNLLQIALLGETGAGKSFLGNQLLQFQHFKSSSSAIACTQQIAYQEHGNLKVYDTPGLMDNTKNAAQVPKIITSLVYANPDQRLKKIDAFLLVIKVQDRANVVNPIEQVLRIFGSRVLASTLIIINYPTKEDGEAKFSEVLEVPYFKALQKKYSDFSIKNIYWNYRTSSKKNHEAVSNQYRLHRLDLLEKLKQLKSYDSKTYRQTEKDRHDLIQQQDLAYYKNKEQDEIVKDGSNKLTFFKIKSEDKQHYISFGQVERSWGILAKDGYLLQKTPKSFSFKENKLQISNNRYYLKGLLSSQGSGLIMSISDPNKTQQYLDSTKADLVLGVKIVAIGMGNIPYLVHKIGQALQPQKKYTQEDFVSIQFVDGKKAIVDFFRDSISPRVKLTLGKFFIYAENKRLKYDNKEHSQYFYLEKE